MFINDTEVAMNDLVPKLKAITDARGGMDERIFMRGRQEGGLRDGRARDGAIVRRRLQAARAGHGSGSGALKAVAIKVDKTLVASVALHVLVLGWGLISFPSKAFEMMPEESLPVDVISADQLAKVMAGMKTGKKENPKPLVEKVAEAKPVPEEAVGKITEKAPVITETAPPRRRPSRRKSSRKNPTPARASKPVAKPSPSRRRSSRRSPIRRRSIRSPRR